MNNRHVCFSFAAFSFCAFVSSSCVSKSQSLEHAEATRRAEVNEARMREQQLEKAREEAQEEAQKPDPAADGFDVPKANFPKIDLTSERASFTAQVSARLDALDARLQQVAARVDNSDAAADLRDDVQKANADLKARVISLRNKSGAILQVTSDETWSITREDLDAQLAQLEKEAGEIEGKASGSSIQETSK